MKQLSNKVANAASFLHISIICPSSFSTMVCFISSSGLHLNLIPPHLFV